MNFVNANLEYAYFDNANLTNAKFSQVPKIENAIMSETTRIEGAHYYIWKIVNNSLTKIPVDNGLLIKV